MCDEIHRWLERVAAREIDLDIEDEALPRGIDAALDLWWWL